MSHTPALAAQCIRNLWLPACAASLQEQAWQSPDKAEQHCTAHNKASAIFLYSQKASRAHIAIMQVDYRHSAVILRIGNPKDWLPEKHGSMLGFWELPPELAEVALQVVLSLSDERISRPTCRSPTHSVSWHVTM